MRYTESHEWVRIENDEATVGITKYAQEELGDVVFVELPETGKKLKAGDESAVLESTKAAADVYAPLSGEIIAVNEKLSINVDKINTEPEEGGWIFKIRLSNLKEIDQLMDREAYIASIEQ